ncbi:MAG: murein biosynthesis integral membrane protein MurJ [Spirochaetales bacterium]|nr:murein biosynthesis integral membrane protein MurJ [Spirochaetales bacterium]
METSVGKSASASFFVMICTFLSRILGFVRLAVITTVFGGGEGADIINLAFSIPNNLRKLLAEGALSAAFIPVLSANLLSRPDGTRARPLVKGLLTFQILVILPFCALCIIFSDFLIRHVLAEFADPAKIEASVGLFRLVINYLLLISLSAVLMGILNAHSRFVVPAITPIIFSISVITSIILLHGAMGVFSMAVGVLIGGVAQILFQYPLFHRLGYDFRPYFRPKDLEFRRIMVRWLPILATSSVFAITQQIAYRFASGLEEGSITAVTIALTFFQLPFGIFSASVTTVLFPRMSRQGAAKDMRGLRDSLQYGLRFLLILLAPSAVFLCVWARRLISTGFQSGGFEEIHTLLSAKTLAMYSLGLFSVASFTFLQRFFYSLNDYKRPFFVAVGVALIDVALTLWLKSTGLRTSGIALANSIAFSAGAVTLAVFAKRILGTINGTGIAKTFFKVCIAILPGIAILAGFGTFVGKWWVEGRTLASFFFVIVGALLFAAPILLVYRLLGVEMLADITKRFRRSPNG